MNDWIKMIIIAMGLSIIPFLVGIKLAEMYICSQAGF